MACRPPACGSNPFSMKFSICNETYQGWDFARACQHIAEVGYHGVEIAPFTLRDDPRDLNDKDVESVRRAAEDAGLGVVGLHWLLVKPAWLNLTTTDPLLQKDTVAFAVHLAGFCSAIGGKVMVWGSPKQRDLQPGWDYDDALKRASDILLRIVDGAKGTGVTIAMEPLAKAETNFLTTAEETVRLIEMVGDPAVKLHLDVKAMSDESKPIPDIIRDCRKHIVHFHANDPNLRGPGFGEVKFEPIADALKEVGYDGYVSVEVFDYSPDPETIAKESIHYLQKVFA
jgi:sugar phosphate isomerase/epimerase